MAYLLQDEDVMVELALKDLVGEVDAQLLEAVVRHNLEAEDVEDPDESALGLALLPT